MKNPLTRNNRQRAHFDALEREAVETHQKNLTTIVETRKKVDKLNIVLKQNNIVFQLAHVIHGYKK